METKAELRRQLEDLNIDIDADELNELTEMYNAFSNLYKEQRDQLEELDPNLYIK